MMNKDEYVKAKLQVELEVDTNLFASGYMKGFIEGFKKGSQVDKSKNTEMCFITKIVLEHNVIKEYEFCEVIKNGGDDE